MVQKKCPILHFAKNIVCQVPHPPTCRFIGTFDVIKPLWPSLHYFWSTVVEDNTI